MFKKLLVIANFEFETSQAFMPVGLIFKFA
jgi:hypothetical protein